MRYWVPLENEMEDLKGLSDISIRDINSKMNTTSSTMAMHYKPLCSDSQQLTGRFTHSHTHAVQCNPVCLCNPDGHHSKADVYNPVHISGSAGQQVQKVTGYKY